MKMKIIVTTCNKYLRFLRGFVYMFNKYWSPNANVTVLGYSAPSFDLPDNFEFISLGEQKKYGEDWSSALIPFFKQLPDEYFILLLDDYYILNVNKLLLYEAEKYMIKGIEKVFLTNLGRGPSSGVFEKEKDTHFNILKQGFSWRLSLQPNFVRTDYFLKYLNPKKTIWQHETNFKLSLNDGAQILTPKQNIVYYSNFLKMGKVSRQISRIKKEDLDAIKRLGVS